MNRICWYHQAWAFWKWVYSFIKINNSSLILFKYTKFPCISCRYLTRARLVYEASSCISYILCRGCVVVIAPWLETRTGGPRDEPRATRELSPSVLLPTVRCLQFQDQQPRDVDHTLFSCFLELLVTCCRTMAPRSLRLGSVFYDGKCV
jgi:hypothetical protein